MFGINKSAKNKNDEGPSVKKVAIELSAHEQGTSQPENQEVQEVAHAHREKNKSGFSFFNALYNVFSLLVMAGIFASGYAFYKYHEKGPLEKDRIVSVPRGSGLSKISTILHKEGVITDRKLFVVAVYARRLQKKLRAGEYSFKVGDSVKNVLQTITFGKTYSYKVTIPEGWSSYKIVQRLLATETLTGPIESIPAEGSLLPDTYSFTKNETREQIIARMREAQKVFLAREWDKRATGLPIKNAYEALILASIVEKETGHAGERDLVAGVFSNRLHKKMRLESDPTIIYGLVGGKGPLGRGILRSEKNKKTPYNTYFIAGLPPTPIANPGRKAIRAVLNPAQTEHLFFVANGRGGHIFSRTYSEHKRNVKKWRQIEKEIRAREKERKAAEKQAALQAATIMSGGGGSLPTNQKQLSPVTLKLESLPEKNPFR